MEQFYHPSNPAPARMTELQPNAIPAQDVEAQSSSTSSASSPKPAMESPTPASQPSAEPKKKGCWGKLKSHPLYTQVKIILGLVLGIGFTLGIFGMFFGGAATKAHREAKEKALEAEHSVSSAAAVVSLQARTPTPAFTPSGLVGTPVSSVHVTISTPQWTTPYKNLTSTLKPISEQPISGPPMHTAASSVAPNKTSLLSAEPTYRILPIEVRTGFSTLLASESAHAPMSALPKPQITSTWITRPSFSTAVKSSTTLNHTMAHSNTSQH